jgi:hypothetical protein
MDDQNLLKEGDHIIIEDSGFEAIPAKGVVTHSGDGLYKIKWEDRKEVQTYMFNIIHNWIENGSVRKDIQKERYIKIDRILYETEL